MTSLFELPAELWVSLWLTIRLAAVVTVLLLVVSLGLGYWFSVSRWRGLLLVETLVNMPIVLPPTVHWLLPARAFCSGRAYRPVLVADHRHDIEFHVLGLVVGSMLYSLPYAVQPVTAAFRSVERSHVDAAISMGGLRGGRSGGSLCRFRDVD